MLVLSFLASAFNCRPNNLMCPAVTILFAADLLSNVIVMNFLLDDSEMNLLLSSTLKPLLISIFPAMLLSE